MAWWGANPPPALDCQEIPTGPEQPARLTMDSFSVVVYRTRISPRLLAHGSKSGLTTEESSLSRFFLEPSYGEARQSPQRQGRFNL